MSILDLAALLYYTVHDFRAEVAMELDLHGKNLQQARIAVASALARATAADYRLNIIHGHRQGSAIRDMVREEFARHPRVLRVEPSFNPGQTIFVLREY